MSSFKQLSFSSGEISPSLWARTDLVKYATGLRSCLNFMVMRHGGLTIRPGTGFVAEVKNSAQKIRLLPFVFNASQTYVLEFGDLYMRVHKNGAQVCETAKTITNATQANPCVISSTAHGYSNGDEVAIYDVGGMTELNGRNFKVAGAAANYFSLQYMDGTAVNSTTFGAYTSGGSVKRVYTITTPYVEADLPELRYVQSADIVTLTHPTYAPRELARTGDTAWTLTAMTFGAAIGTPTNLVSNAPGTAFWHKITAVSATTGEESLPTAAVGSTGTAVTLSWTAVSGAAYYNIYRTMDTNQTGRFGWIGVADGSPFADNSYAPDLLDYPPADRQPFTGAGNYPSTVAYHQQRLLFANTNNNTEGVWTSKSALRKNFMISSPLQDDDAVTFGIVGRQVNAVKHLLEVGKLIVFTASGEWVIEGDAAGILTPSGINPKQHTANGSGALAPLPVGGNALYVQARGSVIRDLGYDYQSDSYRGNELTIFSAHLFDAYTLSDWTYQQIPNSIVWCVRSDGVLLGMTYIREHQVFGWHRHTFDGTVENVCVVPEGVEDVLYLLIKRTINSKVVRYIERLKTRQLNNIVDAVFLDCSLSYDGRNSSATTMTLSGGTAWTYDENLTLTASASFFTSADIGNEIVLTGSDGTVIRCVITAYTSGTVVTVRAHKTVPSSMRSAAITTWSKAVDEVGGLWQLEGKQVGIFADGFVAANPNNTAYVIRTVASGKVTLDKPYSVIHVGLPITADMETLDIDSPQGQTLADKKKQVGRLTAFVEGSRGVWAGVDANNLTELKLRDDENYDAPVALSTGVVGLNIRPEWNTTGKVLIRQIDPVPLNVLAVVPAGYIGA